MNQHERQFFSRAHAVVGRDDVLVLAGGALVVMTLRVPGGCLRRRSHRRAGLADRRASKAKREEPE